MFRFQTQTAGDASGASIRGGLRQSAPWVKSTVLTAGWSLPVTNRLMHRSNASFHSITSSARASSVGGIVRSSALAAFKLITNSTFVARKIGKSAGFSPFRIRAVYKAVWGSVVRLFTLKDVEELYEARILIELDAVGTAFERQAITPELLDELSRNLNSTRFI
jgi:hypothetical protein